MGSSPGGNAAAIGVRGWELRGSSSPSVPNSTVCPVGKSLGASALPWRSTWSGRKIVNGGSNGVLNLPSPTPPSSTSVKGASPATLVPVSLVGCLNRSRLMLRPSVGVRRAISSYEGPAMRLPGAARLPCVKWWLETEECDGRLKRCDRVGSNWCGFEWSKSEL